MGASLIGHQCERSIWMTWRWALKPEFSGRILRLFSTGQREEPRFIEELRGIGATVWDTNEDGQQWRVSACDGHFGGSLDGVAKGLPEAPKSVAILEFKTHSNKSFMDLVKKKVRDGKPQHFDQMTVYMGLMEIDRALYMAANKDTDDVYCEWTHFDKDRFDVLIARAQKLIDMTEPPGRISEDPAYFVCKMCTFWKTCHGGQTAEANCRTCCHASPVANAQWHCDKHDKILDQATQNKGCDQHLFIPALVPYGEAFDGGEDWVAYKHRETGVAFVNGPEGCSDYGPLLSSKELHNAPGSLIADLIALKIDVPGSKVVDGSVEAPPFDTMWDDISTDPDDIPVKSDTQVKREAKEKIKATVKALENLR